LESYEKIKKNRRFTKRPSKYRGLDLNQAAKAKLFSEQPSVITEDEWIDILTKRKDFSCVSRERVKYSIL